jgi:hypothetical protein
MKTIIAIITLGITSVLVGCEDTTSIEEYNPATVLEETETTPESLNIDYESDDVYGSTGALSQTTYTIEEMLIYAIQDEFAARQEYEYILATFDVTTPFSNIIKSEETHIELLLPLFEAYGLTVPEDTSLDHIIDIDSLEETFSIGVLAEELNIAMYNQFLSQDDLPDDLVDAFTKLRDASLNHLAAFEKNAAKYN